MKTLFHKIEKKKKKKHELLLVMLNFVMFKRFSRFIYENLNYIQKKK